MAKTRCDICELNFKNEEALELHNKAKHSSKPNTEDKKKKSKKSLYFIFGLIAVIILLFMIFGTSGNSSNYDSFAQCLTNEGAKMYGAYWCSHCNEQKEMFGSSVKYITYIECSLPNRGGQNDICNEAGIEAYPTWIFADNTRRTGTLSFEELSRITGCPLQ